ncbi:hypothetical protein CC86DRAFT_382938 [Ophiobolus disseminans]|uniref:Gamma-glutamylcyclotransferase AIG2-like domain-containing protein n=1 Tax=Ophiobolus disseminans TaxID=1469910 RepID=A0A6A7A075_9PLEO|nr:hypothetical protein CC86DRAFT_382938 [Ophiobolus disseminans]
MDKNGNLHAASQSSSRAHRSAPDIEPQASSSPIHIRQPPSPDKADTQLFTDALEEQVETLYATPPQNTNSYRSVPFDVLTGHSPKLESADQANTDAVTSSTDNQSSTGVPEKGGSAVTSMPIDRIAKTASTNNPQGSCQDAQASGEGKDEMSHITLLQDPRKQIDPEFVRVYNIALANRWSTNELYHQVVPTPPIFLYCSLMLPWVLGNVIGATAEQTATYMVSALLNGFSRVTVKYAALPTLVPDSKTKSPHKPLQGLLLGSVKDWALKKIEAYIDLSDQKRDIVEVDVATSTGEGITVAAYTYVWNGPISALEDKSWDPVEYMKRGTREESSQTPTSSRGVVGLRMGRK